MSKTIDFYYDFASPNVYFSWKVLPGIAARTGAQINIIPCLLGGVFKATNNQAPMQAFAGVTGKLAYDFLEIKRFMEKHGISAFKMNPAFPINTVPLIRGLLVAQRDGFGDAYIEAVQTAMWENEKNMGDPEVIAAVLTEAGLDGPAILAGTQDPAIKEQLKANTEAAVARGVFGLPAFFIGDEMFFGKERLGQIEDMLA